jgi:cobalamin biosynthesis Mg chelatase CobN
MRSSNYNRIAARADVHPKRVTSLRGSCATVHGVVSRRARISVDQLGFAAMSALLAVGFLTACGSGNDSAAGTLTNSGGRTTPTAPAQSVTAPTRSTPTLTAPTQSTTTVTDSHTTTVVAVIPPPATTTVSSGTTTSGVSPAAAAAATAAASQNNESSSTQWGWIAFAVLAATILIGGIVWWWRKHSANAETDTRRPGNASSG